MKSIKELLPRASQSFIKANPQPPFTQRHQMQSSASLDAAKGKRGKMNKTEAAFAARLDFQRQFGEILRWEYEGITLRWFDMRYTPDFVVFPVEQDIAFHGGKRTGMPKLIEIKGPHIHYRQQALARFKGARGFWPEFTFELWQKTKRSGWKQIL